MTEMDLGRLNSADFSTIGSIETTMLGDPLGLAQMRGRFLSYVCWPHDRRKRDEYLVTKGAAEVAYFEQRLNALADQFGCEQWSHIPQEILEKSRSEMLKEVRDVLFEPYGGLGGVAAAPGFAALRVEIENMLEVAIMLGLIPRYLVQMRIHHETQLRGGAAEGKVVDLLAWVNDRSPKKGWGKRNIHKALSKHRRHLPLFASLLDAFTIADRSANFRSVSEFLFSTGLFVVLSRIRAYANFLREFKAPADQTYRYAHTAFLVPPLTMSLPIYEFGDVKPMSQEDLDFLENRKVPSKYD
tara:strand:- start:416 stop:1312 length:897 start_codon:yes stop_codon:yes gene_type:complete